MSNERELQLLRRIVERDRTAFAELYLIYHPRLARFLSRMTSQRDLIENIVNETMWIVWRKCAGFRGASRVSTWILGIAFRTGLKLRRKAASLQPLPERATPIAPDLLLMSENWQWLHRALEELPVEQRTALELAYIGGHTCDEIAAIMLVPVSTVKTRMFHARVKLRRSLPRLAGETLQRRAGTKAAISF